MVMFKTLKNYNFSGKTVLLRVDLNSPVVKGRIINNERIRQSAKSILSLKKLNAKVVVLAHQGRKGDKDFTNLKQHAKLLKKYTSIDFVDDIYGERAQKKIRSLNPGEALLLDNVRFLDDEKNNEINSNYVKILSSLADIYVNDAFSVSHREQASVTCFPKKMKSCIGPNMEKELISLEKIKMKNVLYILGGSKAEENMLFLQRNKKIIAGGKFGQLCMLASGFKFGKHEKLLDTTSVKALKNKLKKIYPILPIDFAIKKSGKRKEISTENFPNGYEIFDIGFDTIKLFKEEIKKAKAIFMKGPLGFVEEKQFRKGTIEILRAVGNSGAFSIIGGGHLTTAIKQSKINKNKFDYISLSGGALANYVAGEKLPGLEVLK
ncbi:MAG: phosphoglycerate kinase [Candidatus Pacearchaeota archaeon]